MTGVGQLKRLRETVKNINAMIVRLQELKETIQLLINETEPPDLTDSIPESGRVYLSPREMSVIRLVGQGKRNGEIARDLGLKERYVKGVVSRLYDKLEVHDRGGLVLYAIKAGMVSLNK